jgi:hypothetical protein
VPSKEWYTSRILLERLTDGVRRNRRPVTFLIGSAASAPYPPGSPGVPGVDGVIDLIKEEFEGQQLQEFESQIASAENKYQEAFHFLQGRRGPEIANSIIKRAVWQARKPRVGESVPYRPSETTPDETCRLIDQDIAGWHLSPTHVAFGQLAVNARDEFGSSVLTTNFDPLIEVAIASAGGQFFRTVLHRDGDLAQTQGNGSHVVHLHGYWYGSDTLHPPRQLTQNRPRLKASLAHLIAGRTLIVMGYGGWDDVFTHALMDVVLDDRSSPDVLWTFKGPSPNLPERLAEKLEAGVDRGRVTFYIGVDCHVWMPELAKLWAQGANPVAGVSPNEKAVSIPIRFVGSPEAAPSNDRLLPPLNFSRGDQDHPPKIEFYVGRSDELKYLKSSTAAVLSITGIGGAGKSALAAHYFADAQALGAFDHYVWRDCKEESERFERQFVSIVAVLSQGKVSEYELATQPIETIHRVVCKFISKRPVTYNF